MSVLYKEYLLLANRLTRHAQPVMNGNIQQAPLLRQRQKNCQTSSYELLGAPILAFRNEQAYSSDATTIDHQPHQRRPIHRDDLKELFKKNRACARWYYPIDFHRIKLHLQCVAAGADDDDDDKKPEMSNKRKRSRKHVDERHHGDDGIPPSTEDIRKDGSQKTTQRPREETEKPRTVDARDKKSSKKRKKKFKHAQKTKSSSVEKTRRKQYKAMAREAKNDRNNTICRTDFIAKQNFELQQEARRFLLSRSHDESQSYHLLRLYQKYDVNLTPAGISLQGKGLLKYGFDTTVRQNLLKFAKERKFRADPAYMAPFSSSDWATGLARLSGHKADNPVARDFGNCLCSFSCLCTRCKKSNNPTWWILHPTGPLLETIRLSHLATPRGRRVWTDIKFSQLGTAAVRNQGGLDTGEGVRQIVQCGDDTFIARGSSYFTIFRVAEQHVRNSPSRDKMCLGAARALEQVQREDLRSFVRGSLSYRPRTLTVHPRFVGPLTDGRVAVVYESENRNVTNTIRQFTIGDEVRSTEHTISSLQLISELQYSSHHPMVIWCSARSFVRSLPTRNHFRGNPRVGFGTALFSLDMRSNKAVFEWSPSAEGFVNEGIHSISGLLTDWDRESTLFVSSSSAKKTWELDMRMPCRSVASWSLPHLGEGPGASAGLYGTTGAGMILDRPKSPQGQDRKAEPVFAVNRTPGTTGIHLYQRPNTLPLFRCPPIEALHTAKVNDFSGSVATSKVFPLPDVGESVFTCGLTTIRIPTRNLFVSRKEPEKEKILNHAPRSLCVVSSTNKGDVYLHPLLESDSMDSLERNFPDTPVGFASVPVPNEHRSLDVHASGLNRLPLNLTNEYPLPSSAIVLPFDSMAGSQKKEGNHWNPRWEEQDGSLEVPVGTSQTMTMSVRAGNRVKVLPSFVDAQREAFAATLDCFDDNLADIQRWQMLRDPNPERTDMSLDELDNAQLEWNQEAFR